MRSNSVVTGVSNVSTVMDRTFKEVAAEWITEQSSMLKPTSINRYKFLLERHIIPEFGSMTMRQVTTEKVRKFMVVMSESGRIDNGGGLAASTVNDMLILIKSILGYVELKYNVPIHIGKIRIMQTQKTKSRFYSAKDIHMLIAAAWDRYELNHSDLRCMGVLLCIYTGIRISELCALRWEDIDLRRGILYINSSLQRIRTEDYEKKTTLILGAPKTEKSTRIIPLKSNILEKLREIQPLYQQNAFLLSGKTDKAIEPRNMQYYFKQMQLNAGIEPLCFHSLRHTFASACIRSGMDVKTLSEILGHSNVNTTWSYYVHSSIDQKLKQIEAMDF